MKKQLLLTALAVIVSLVTTLSASAQVSKRYIVIDGDPELQQAVNSLLESGKKAQVYQNGSLEKRLSIEGDSVVFTTTLNGRVAIQRWYLKPVVEETKGESVADTTALSDAHKKYVDGAFTNLLQDKFNREKWDALFYQLEGSDEFIPVARAKKYGYKIGAGIGMDITTAGYIAPRGHILIKVDDRWWDNTLRLEIGKSQYSSKAINAGKDYVTFGAQVTGSVYPFKLDYDDVNRLGIYVGASWNWYQSDSPNLEGSENYIRSAGYSLAPVFGISYTRRAYLKAREWSVFAQVKPEWLVLTNLGAVEPRTTFEVGFSYLFNVAPEKFDGRK
jgi:hypothetical protein